MKSTRTGIAAALAAFFLWGVLPVFWKQFGFLPPDQIVAHRTLWSLVLLVPLMLWLGEWRAMLAALRVPRQAAWHLLSGVLLSANWLLYIWATVNGRIVEASLGYYLNPFFNMLFGTLWFGERHRRAELAAIGIALAGTLLLVPAAGHFPWLALTLALTFSLYGVVRKRAPLGSLAGLSVETALLAPIAAAWLLWHPGCGSGAPYTTTQWLLLAATGLATALPLLCFAHAARILRLTTLGVLQFIGPTLQFFIGWQYYGESMTGARLASFALIWLAVAIYAAASLKATTTPRI